MDTTSRSMLEEDLDWCECIPISLLQLSKEIFHKIIHCRHRNKEKQDNSSGAVMKLFEDAWNEIINEKQVTKVELPENYCKTEDHTPLEFWKRMFREVDEQKKNPDYLFTENVNKFIRKTYTIEIGPPSEDEEAVYTDGLYFTFRLSAEYLNNLNLGIHQWYIVQDFPPKPKIIKMLRRIRIQDYENLQAEFEQVLEEESIESDLLTSNIWYPYFSGMRHPHLYLFENSVDSVVSKKKN